MILLYNHYDIFDILIFKINLKMIGKLNYKKFNKLLLYLLYFYLTLFYSFYLLFYICVSILKLYDNKLLLIKMLKY